MKEKKKILEVDLYKPIQRHFIKQGFQVNGEVKDCDMTAVKDEQLVIVELKLSLTIDLLIQATKRQRLTDLVYIAIPKPKRLRSKRWYDVCHLVSKLELGLIIVSFSGNGSKIDFVTHPTPFDQKKSLQQNKRKRNALLIEIEGRSADYNIGGSNKVKIMTAYKETCIQIAYYLEQCGPMSPSSLAKMGTGVKTLSILNKNYYDWYVRVKRGVYAISDKGRQELTNYPDLLDNHRKVLQEKINQEDK